MLALTRRMTVKRTSMTRISGCYADAEGFIDGTFNVNFLKLSPAEREKNLELAKTVLFAQTNQNLKRYAFPESGQGSMLCICLHDRYDIPAKASDKERLGESEEMFPYLICAVCPLVGEYEPGNPICGFLFPAFVDRSGDLERVNIYAERAAWGDQMASILGAKGRKFRCGL